MALRVARGRIPGPELSPRASLVLFVLVLGGFVGIAILGRLGVHWPSTAAPTPPPSAVAEATSAPTPSEAPSPQPTPQETPEPSDVVPGPSPSPFPEPHGGAPRIVSGPIVRVSEPTGFVASGIRTVTGPDATYGQAIAAVDDAVWVSSSRGLLRIDPRTGAEESWIVDQDLRFAAGSIAAARAGGVWIATNSILRRFDGQAFRDAVDLGGFVGLIAEGRAGVLWAIAYPPSTSVDIGLGSPLLVRIAGSTRTIVETLQPSPDCYPSSIAVDTRGGVWVAWTRGVDNVGWASRFDGSAWTVYQDLGLDEESQTVQAVVAAPDGSVWASSGSGVARFDGRSWRGWSDTGVGSPTSLAVGPDGSVWVAGIGASRWIGGKWVEQSVPGSDLTQPVRWIVPTRSGTVFLTEDGAIRGSAGGRTWIHPAPDPDVRSGYGRVLGVSSSEVFAGGYAGVWRYDGTWARESGGDGGPFIPDAMQMVLGAGGDVWGAGGESGLWLRHAGRWSQVDRSNAMGIATDATGRTWVATRVGAHAYLARAFIAKDGEVLEVARTAETDLVFEPSAMGVDLDGSVWLGGSAPGVWGWPVKGALSRYAAGLWEVVPPRPGEDAIPMKLVVDGQAVLWASGMTIGSDGHILAWIVRRDGEGWTTVWEGRDVAAPDLAVSPRGRVWATLPDGLAILASGTVSFALRGIWIESVSIAPDGTVWVSDVGGIARLVASSDILEEPPERQ